MSDKKAKLAKAESRDQYGNSWLVPLTGTCTKKPLWCCYAMLCPQCASYQNRKEALHGDMTRYVCCNGHWPCSGKMKEKDCPEFCLCAEVCCCFAQSVASTRWMLQDKLAIQNTKCDNCIISTMVALQFLSCICNIAACLTQSPELDSAADAVDLIADVAWCTVCGCMQTQAKVEMEENQRFQAHGGPQLQAPGPQEMTYAVSGHPVPGPMHAPPPQHMGGVQPPSGYPHAGGYPPQGYPPQGYPPQGGGYPPQQQGGYPPQGGGPPSGYPPQPSGYPAPAGYPAPH